MPNKAINFQLDILPASDGTYSLGNEEKKWLINGRDISDASEHQVDTSIQDGSESQGLPTSQAVAEFVEGKGYKNTLATEQEAGLMSAADKRKILAFNGESIHKVQGKNTDAAGQWTGTSAEIESYYDGLMVVFTPYSAGGNYTTTLNINGLGERPCYINGTQRLTTEYSAGIPILFTYQSNRWQAVHINVDSFAKAAEGYAIGKQAGDNVSSDSPYYHNNSKYYSDLAGTHAQTAANSSAQAVASAELAEEMAARAGYMNFYVDENGHLIYQHTESVDVDFSLVNGRLVASWQTA